MLILLAAATLPGPPVQTAIKEAVGRELNGPFSAQYDWQPIKNDTVYCGWVNAKNPFGAYAGYKPFMVLYAIGKSGKVIIAQTELSPVVVNSMCPQNGYRLTR